MYSEHPLDLFNVMCDMCVSVGENESCSVFERLL